MCVSNERAYVHESIAEAFEQRVAELVGNIRLAGGDTRHNRIGFIDIVLDAFHDVLPHGLLA